MVTATGRSAAGDTAAGQPRAASVIVLAPFWIVMVAGSAPTDLRKAFCRCFRFAMRWFVAGVRVFRSVR